MKQIECVLECRVVVTIDDDKMATPNGCHRLVTEMNTLNAEGVSLEVGYYKIEKKYSKLVATKEVGERTSRPMESGVASRTGPKGIEIVAARQKARRDTADKLFHGIQR